MTIESARVVARRGFTLVEILIVVVILGILAAIVIPQFARASADAQQTATFSELQKLRRHIEMYKSRNSGALPVVVADSDGDWGQIVGANSEYLQAAPANAWVGGTSGRRIGFGSGPDTVFQFDYGWIFDPASGQIWAGSFNGSDVAIPR